MLSTLVFALALSPGAQQSSLGAAPPASLPSGGSSRSAALGKERRPIPIFFPPAGYELGAQAFGDLNEDGLLDCVAVTGDFLSGSVPDGVGVFLGAPNGSFVRGEFASMPTSNCISTDIHLADITGDGHLDALVLNACFGDLTTYLGVGDGTFVRGIDGSFVDAPSGGFGWGAFDIDQDGVLDLIGAGSAVIEVQLGKGDGTFSSPQLIAAPNRPSEVHPADFDGDGILDLVARNIGTSSDSSTEFYKGLGGGMFAAPVLTAAPFTVTQSHALDMTGDGRIDLLLSDDRGFLLRENAGGGTFTDRRLVTTGADPLVPAFGDINEDGFLDLLYLETGSASTPAIKWLAGDGAGNYSFNTTSSSHFSLRTSGITLHDVNLDGHLDLIGGAADGIFVVQGIGDGTFRLAGTESALPSFSQTLLLEDMDSDGALDLIYLYSGADEIIIHPGLGDGSFGVRQRYPTGDDPRGIVAGDWNGDDVLDFAVTSYTGDTVDVHLGPSYALTSTHAVENAPEEIHADDLDLDGDLDLLVSFTIDTMTAGVFYGNGDGTFAAPTYLGNAGFGRGARSGHLDDDGLPDVVVQGTGSISIYYGRADGTFGSADHELPAPLKPESLAVADVDGDGLDDVVTGDTSAAGYLGILFSGPNRTIAVGAHTSESVPHRIHSADLDGDGALELVILNYDIDTADIVRARGDRISTPLRTSLGGDADALAVGDIDNDGLPDLVAQSGLTILIQLDPLGLGTGK